MLEGKRVAVVVPAHDEERLIGATLGGETLALVDLERVYTGYGFPNDLLVHLKVVNARVRDFASRPVYGVGEQRRWSATSRRYEPRRSTPTITTCGRALGFRRTRTTNEKVGQ
jgi:hypothetical protein